jgi:hypothetical protein
VNIITDIDTALASVGLTVATGMYEGNDLNYIVITPLTERNEDISDDSELTETADADVNLYYVGDYQTTKNTIVSSLKSAGFFIADRRYIGYEPETKQHHYVVTVEKKEAL